MEHLHRFIFEAWDSDKSGRISIPHALNMAHIPSTPIDAAEDACNELYQGKLTNPSAF